MDRDQQRMSIDNGKLPISPKAPVLHDPSLNQGGQINSSVFAGDRDIIQHGTAEAFIYNSEKLEDEMKEVGLQIKHHEDNVKFLKAEKNKLDDLILDMRVALGMIHSSSGSGTGSENKESSNGRSEEETIEEILKYNKSAACIWMQTHRGTQITHNPLMKDVMGVVALLGKVDGDNLSRILSDYLGLETMSAIVCKTHDGVQALEIYHKEAFIHQSSGHHDLGASNGKPLDGRCLVICLENIRPYTGEFIAGDPQRRLAIMKPRYLNEETPGFLGFAVNMISIDAENLYGVTSTGHGLRETLFYKLFSRCQVYKTREDMLQALPLIADGAVSLDGGIIRRNGVFLLGEREKEIKFPRSSGRSNLPENYFETKSRMKELEWKRRRFVEDLSREEVLLENAKIIFEIKKQEFVKFLAQSSSYDTAKLGDDICRYGLCIRQCEANAESLTIKQSNIELEMAYLGAYIGLDSVHDLDYDKDVVVERIEGKADSAASVIHKLLRSPKSEQLYLNYAHDILGAVALLGEVRTHKLSRC